MSEDSEKVLKAKGIGIKKSLKFEKPEPGNVWNYSQN